MFFLLWSRNSTYILFGNIFLLTHYNYGMASHTKTAILINFVDFCQIIFAIVVSDFFASFRRKEICF